MDKKITFQFTSKVVNKIEDYRLQTSFIALDLKYYFINKLV